MNAADQSFFKIHFYFTRISVLLASYARAPCAYLVSREVKRGWQILWNYSYGWLWTCMWLLWTELISSARATSAINYRVIVLVPDRSLFYLFLHFESFQWVSGNPLHHYQHENHQVFWRFTMELDIAYPDGRNHVEFIKLAHCSSHQKRFSLVVHMNKSYSFFLISSFWD